METIFKLSVNGKRHEVACEAETPLLFALRNDLELNGAKFGCGQGQCGTCAVLLNGSEIRSCVVPVSAVASGQVVTLEGLGTSDSLHPLQQAFIDLQAAQCGYCTSGMIIAAKALLDRNPRPTADDVKVALEGHICRCGVHSRIVKAVLKAASEMSK